jgi:hypothetical protein
VKTLREYVGIIVFKIYCVFGNKQDSLNSEGFPLINVTFLDSCQTLPGTVNVPMASNTMSWGGVVI